ncbi:hypothetical protein BJ085DRAFT_11860, partial [Dimargaris cristalligena]
YLGLDLSTQRLKATLIDQAGTTQLTCDVDFDQELPQYSTKGGCYTDVNRAFAHPLMWVEALDLLFFKLAAAAAPQLAQLAAIACCAQQHSSVYWNEKAQHRLRHLDTNLPLKDQLGDCFSITDSPIWQDTSTGSQCRQLERQIGGPAKLASITGSIAYERFTINQIAKIYQTNPELYQATPRISLVSSFLTTLLLGDFAPIDYADGSGMNVLDIRSKEWSPTIVRIVADDSLLHKLGTPAATQSVISESTAPYWQTKYGINSACRLLAGTGDNPASVLALAANPGDAIVSLGTSDTVMFPCAFPSRNRQEDDNLDGHILCHPLATSTSSDYIALLCFRNGSLTREWVRDQYAGGSWSTFADVLECTPPGLLHHLGFYYLSPEILPRSHGVQRFGLNGGPVESSPRNGQQVSAPLKTAPLTPLSEFPDPAWNVRAVVESQALHMRLYLARKGLDHPQRIMALGGASINPAITQIFADVLNAPVWLAE